MKIHYLGIRHHGPGCTRNLQQALNRIKPDVVLLEMPADVPQNMLQQVLHADMQPPVALLIYNSKNTQKASFYPFAAFSPEWQTIRYCLENQAHLRPFDLPKSIWLNLEENLLKIENEAEEPENEQDIAEKDAEDLRHDPISYIASLGGYSDSERWWDAMIESQGDDEQIFQSIYEMMTTLRKELNREESYETQLREAFMRESLRDVIKIGYQNIVIVCGAWHLGGLDVNLNKKEDAKLLKGLKKNKDVAMTWVPWTYERLSFSSGYGAGVISPAWYEILFEQTRAEVIPYWMTQAARLLRAEQLDASSAHIIEAVRLSHTLAALRGLAIPGLEEMKESCVSIFGNGYAEGMQIIENKLIVGDKMGDVPADLKDLPLQRDIDATRKTLRLKENRYKDLEIDIRKPFDKEKSIFLHRLNTLNIFWGAKSFNSNAKTSGKEYWNLDWKPELELKIIEASFWGNTLEIATKNFILSQTNDCQEIKELSKLIKDCQNVNLTELIPPIIAKLETLVTVSRDISELIHALPELANLSRYNKTNLRKIDAETLEKLLDEIIPRICLGIPALCTALDEAAADAVWAQLVSVNSALSLLENPPYNTYWALALEKVANKPQIDGLLAGGASRMLYNKQIWTKEMIENALSFALSAAADATHASRWIKGYLHGGAMILIYEPSFLKIMDKWLQELNNEVFQEVLAFLRKTFSDFSLPERQKIFNLAISNWKPANVQGQKTNVIDVQRAEIVQVKLKEWVQAIYN
jgi:hypothetical protein